MQQLTMPVSSAFHFLVFVYASHSHFSHNWGGVMYFFSEDSLRTLADPWISVYWESDQNGLAQGNLDFSGRLPILDLFLLHT